MSNVVELSSLFHRSRNRIIEFGEVFTPESYVENMLDLLARGKKNFWNNEDLIFFEPTCGHGNIATAIYKRRLEAIYKKAESQEIKNSPFYAVANALNTLWAIDIEDNNIQSCRTRLLVVSLEFLKEKTGVKSDYNLINKNQRFFAHLLCSLRWQIHENECLSSLSEPDKASRVAGKTRIGGKWFQKNGHKEIDFEMSWINYFRECEKEKVAPIDFERSLKFIEAILNGSTKGYQDFDFAKFIITDQKQAPAKSVSRGPAIIGV